MTPTREDMAHCCEDILVGAVVEDVNEVLAAAAAELRRTCSSCQLFSRQLAVSPKSRICDAFGFGVPADGSGFCHRHEVKP